MGIPESQLSKWSDHGPQHKWKRTHKTIRKVLEQYPPLLEVRYSFDLQGSYSNDTNIRGHSDVDVVLELRSTSHYKADSTYDTWKLFRRDALRAMRKGFGGKYVGEGKKSIKVKAGRRRLAADVVVCLTYSNYGMFSSHMEGIMFYALPDKHQVVSHPKQHYENGKDKDGRTSQRYRETVRMFKSARNHLECEGRIGANLAPSYFVECLVYNAPDYAFQPGFQDRYCAVVNWMRGAWLDAMVCQNGQQRLFGPSPEQWNMEDAETFIDELGDLWDDWD